MEKVLILTLSAGQGHNSCAWALKEYFSERGILCDIIDVSIFKLKILAGVRKWSHDILYCYVPDGIRIGYRLLEKYELIRKGKAGVRGPSNIAQQRVLDFIADGGYDTVICTHVDGAKMLSQDKKKQEHSFATAFLATDYSRELGVIFTHMHYYFLTDKALFSDFEKIGISSHSIVLSGIPIRKSIWECTSKEDARRKLGLDEKSRHLLVMGGSMGCGKIEKIVEVFMECSSKEHCITILCGRNRRLQCRLQQKFTEKRVRVVGYTDEVSLYMDAADVYLTKPGGISVTEAAVKRLPMVLMDVVGANEERNLKFFIDLGVAKTADTPLELAMLCEKILNSQEELERMAMAFPQIPDACEIIYRTLEK